MHGRTELDVLLCAFSVRAVAARVPGARLRTEAGKQTSHSNNNLLSYHIILITVAYLRMEYNMI